MRTLRNFPKFVRKKINEGANIRFPKVIGDQESSTFYQPADIPAQKTSVIIEGDRKELGIKAVKKKSEVSGFSYFLDGIERKRVIFSYNFIPITYAYVAAVIMKRTNKKMHSINLTEEMQTIYVPCKENNDSPEHYFDADEFTELDINITNIGIKDKKTEKYPLYPPEFEQKAHSQVQETRRKIEQNLTDKWLNNNYNDGWLFVDGPLATKSKSLLSNAKAVGIIKSHHANYFSDKNQFKIYNLKKGERSNVFQPEKEDIYSWYLKIHENKRSGENTFGLVRIEIPAQKELLERVDEISSWILLETNPVAFPASRWDRMIYPIKYCEDYLKSKAPTWTMLESLSQNK